MVFCEAIVSDRVHELNDEIDSILARPLPPYPERYIPRERLHALMSELLVLEGFAGGDAKCIDLAARRFAIDKIPQNLFSYPMADREKRIMASDHDKIIRPGNRF